MEILFDINEEELPIFLAEVDEHLHTLDDGLIRLERDDADQELVQTVFRSAHTIKGMSGMIGHQRMTDVTHAMETVLDGVRKNEIRISSQLVNVCLEAVDHLRSLRDEVSSSQVSPFDIGEIVSSLKGLLSESKEETAQKLPGGEQAEVESEVIDLQKLIPDVESPIPQKTTATVKVSNPLQRLVQVQAKIDTKNMASAARAFQLMMALQDIGDIQAMSPTQAQIEATAVVGDFAASVLTAQAFEQISAALVKISGVDEISVDGKLILSGGIATSKQNQLSDLKRNGSQEKGDEIAKALSTTAVGAGEKRNNPFGRRTTDMTVRMNVERLDNLVNLVGELITDRNHLKQLHSRTARTNSNYDKIAETIMHLGQITDELQGEVMHIRMFPISTVFSKFPRMVHDLSLKIGKQIEVIVQGEKTEMDRSMLEAINDPLIHLVRNSVDHGIELPEERVAAGKPKCGKLLLTARHEQGRIILTVEDDGNGIDTEKLRQSAVQKGLITAEEAANLTEEQSIDLMFVAGLSTAKKVTDISGRGVGLDIVNTNIQRINGSIHVETQPGHGTRFQITLPLTLAIVPALLVKVQHSTFAIPLVMITETFRLAEQEIQFVHRKPVTRLRESVLSLVKLADIFAQAQQAEPQKYSYAVVVQSGKQRIGLIVDALIGEEDVVVKPLGAFIGDIPGVSSAAILGEGQVALIVDVFGLFKLAGI